MYSIKNIVGKESNTAKGVNTATEFNEFKAKSINLELRKLTKYHYLFSMINDTFKMIALIRLHIFINTKIFRSQIKISAHKKNKFLQMVINGHK